MEEDSRDLKAELLNRPHIQQQFEKLKEIVDDAQKQLDYDSAHDKEIKRAIDVVEHFLRRKKRVCYGGQAINALLPEERKFYDPEYTVPDYDFFTPDVDGDVDELMEMLEEKEFDDVNKKIGLHEGTMKIYVNFVPVADITHLPEFLFHTVQKRAKVVNGIFYSDPDFLRMMMYLELSRPRGEVARWEKVYERLTLLNHSYPPGRCTKQLEVVKGVEKEDRAAILNFLIENYRILVSPEIIELYEKKKGTISLQSMIDRGGPVLFFTSDLRLDTEDIVDILKANSLKRAEPGNVKYKIHKSPTDHLFSYAAIYRQQGNRLQPIALLFQENACHGYVRIFQPTGTNIAMGSPDALLHLYYTLHLFGDEQKRFFKTSLTCLIQKIYSVSIWHRNHPTSVLPAFNIFCSGHQKGVATLIKEKVSRIRRAKMELYAGRGKSGGKSTGKSTGKSNSKNTAKKTKTKSKRSTMKARH